MSDQKVLEELTFLLDWYTIVYGASSQLCMIGFVLAPL